MSRNGKKHLLVIVGYDLDAKYRTLKMMCDNEITGTGLPLHSSHVLQQLDVAVFGNLKEEFKRRLSVRTTKTTTKQTRHDRFTIFDMLTRSYNMCVNPKNAISGNQKTGLW